MNYFRQIYTPSAAPRAILITGGTSGIGRAAALLLVALGDHVAVTGRRADRLSELSAEVEKRKLTGRLLTIEADVTNPAAMQRAAALALAEFNRLDVLIANAGI